MEANGKLPAVLSYFTILGWIIGLILHQNKPTSLSALHLRQTLGLYILAIGISIASLALGFLGLLISAANIILLIFWVIGLINAATGKEVPVPVIGNFIEKTLKPYIN